MEDVLPLLSATESQAQLGAGHRARLRERFLKTGFSGFSEHEIVELMLTLCIARRDVKPQAKALLKKFGSLKGVFDANIQDLQSVVGVGFIAATAIKIIREASTVYLQSQLVESQACLLSSDEISRYWCARLGGITCEVFEVAYLDNHYRVLPNGIERMQQGDINRVAIYPRQVMSAALQRSAAGIIVAHNHPCGIPDPSNEDIKLTHALVQAAYSLNIQIVDHVIIGHNSSYSFRKTGLLSRMCPPAYSSNELDL